MILEFIPLFSKLAFRKQILSTIQFRPNSLRIPAEISPAKYYFRY